jgi:hypothetical protein
VYIIALHYTRIYTTMECVSVLTAVRSELKIQGQSEG